MYRGCEGWEIELEISGLWAGWIGVLRADIGFTWKSVALCRGCGNVEDMCSVDLVFHSIPFLSRGALGSLFDANSDPWVVMLEISCMQ